MAVMSVLAFVLSTTLALAQAPGPAAAEGPIAAPTIEMTGPSPVAPAYAPPALRWKGTGLIVSAGILGGIGLGLNFARVGIARHQCPADSPDTCGSNSLNIFVIGPTALASNTVAFALSAGAGGVRGRWAAHDAAYRGGRQRSVRAQIGVGAALTALGLAGYVTVRVISWLRFNDAFSCDEQAAGFGSGYEKCFRSRWSGYLAGITLTQAASVVGVGLLSHGTTYRRNLRRFQGTAGAQVGLRPVLSRDFTGLSLTGRF